MPWLLDRQGSDAIVQQPNMPLSSPAPAPSHTAYASEAYLREPTLLIIYYVEKQEPLHLLLGFWLAAPCLTPIYSPVDTNKPHSKAPASLTLVLAADGYAKHTTLVTQSLPTLADRNAPLLGNVVHLNARHCVALTNICPLRIPTLPSSSVARSKEYVESKTAKYGGLHGVVNNAGVLGNTFFDDFLTIEDYKRTADVNLWGAIRIVQAFKPLVKRTRGRIVTATSVCARFAMMGTGPYTVSKFALAGYCDIIRPELRLFGVSVHVLEPGFFTTHLTSRKNVESQLDTMYGSCSEQVKLEYGKEFFHKMRKKTFWLLGLLSSKQINQVTEAYYHALTAVYPRARYHVGWDSILLFTPLSFIPSELQDLITRIVLFIIKIPSPPLTSQKIKSF
ncbi:hypothetical protein KIN20_034768 [Parelaphostrongylus tenuis]|uniref:Uncharacterized protein n=1 Tax=Parelaphostrongylus tenuis TaxID=148309 RepID=A0AAD5RAI5_PARTN|nr:hypothetical protein KIN20_034768 [Parelaphostrongylus tenuis]